MTSSLTALPSTLHAVPPSRAEIRARYEARSPFVRFESTDTEALEDAHEESTSVVLQILRDPKAIVERLLDREKLVETVTTSLWLVVFGMVFFAATVVSAREYSSPLRSATILPLNVLLALAAAVGPSYATGVLVVARLPVARLVAVMLAATATGASILVGLAPIPYALYKFDEFFAGPLGMFLCFAFAAVATGTRLRELLLTLADAQAARSTRELTAGERFRAGIVARMAMVFLAFASILSSWAFDVFV